jgi:selenocysteine lyase/cysteine desulfurase
VKGMDSEEIVKKMDECKIGLRYGHFSSKRLIDSIGIGSGGERVEELGGNGKGVVRVSLLHYNLLSEVQKLISVLEEKVFKH